MRNSIVVPRCGLVEIMRTLVSAVLALQVLAQASVLAAEQKYSLELNTIEPVENRCRLNFVIQNQIEKDLESMKLDLVVFGTDGAILRRLLTEMGPVRPLKTNVRTFLLDVECAHIGAILINDVTACAPETPSECLDGLSLSSRVKEVRLYK